MWAILAQRAQINFGNLPEIVYHPGTFGILFSTYYDLGRKKKNPYPAYYLGQTVCEVNICALDSTKVILFVYLWEKIKLSTRQKALMTTAGHNYI